MVQPTGGVKQAMNRVPFSAIVADYREHKLTEELHTDWGSLVFYRMPAFVLAWALVPLGIHPNSLTTAGLLVLPLMAIAAWMLPAGTAFVVVTILALAFNVLDCADGPLARATGQSSLSGRYMDASADLAYRAVAYGCYGLIADHVSPNAVFPLVAVGLCCGILATYARVNRLYAAKLMPERPTAETGARSAFDVAFSFLSGLDTLLPLIALIAWAADALPLAMLWFLFFTAGDAVVEVAGNLARARRIDSEQAGGL